MPHPSHESPTTPRRARRLAATAAALVLALGLAPSAPAAAPEALRWKFQKGETLRYSLVQKTETRLKAAEQEQGSTVNQTSDIRWDVQEVSPEGVAKMTQVIERVRVKLEAANQPPFEFDSNDKDKAIEGPLATTVVPMFKALAGFECSLTMDPRGRIESVTIPQKTIDSLKQSFTGPAGNLFSEESMKNMITQSGLVLPAEAIEQGKGWTDQAKLPVPQLGTIVTSKTYTVVGPESGAPGKVKITLDAKMSVEANANAQASFEIKEQKNEGTFSFDADKGRIAKSHVEVKMVQLITAGPNQIQQTVNNTMEMTLTPESAAK